MFRIVTLLAGGACAALAAGAIAANTRPNPPLGGPSGLETAFWVGDLGALTIHAKALSASHLTPLIIEEAPSLAAIWAAPSVSDRHAMLVPLAVAAAHWDHRIAPYAALSARAIARQLTAAELESFEVLDVEVDVWMSTWGKLAQNTGARNDVRVLAAEVVFALGPLVASPAAATAMRAIVTNFRRDDDPELHRVIADLEILLPPPGPL